MGPGLGAARLKVLLLFTAWCILAVMSVPVALLVLLLAPLVWLAALPFRLVALVVRAVFALIGAVLLLPARLLGWRG